MNKGLLLVLMQPPASLEEEFNAWYDTEHIPERKAVPGFETGLRFVCVDGGGPKYLALYDMECIDVLDTQEYLAVSGDNFSPWTKRVTGRTRVHRAACVQAHPGNAITGVCARLVLIRFSDLPESQQPSVITGMRKNFGGNPNVRQLRVFHYELAGVSGSFGLAECHAPVSEALDIGAFGSAADRIDLVASYRPY